MKPNVVSDTGPTFTLENLASGIVVSCAPSGQENSTFVGTCESADEAETVSTEFSFDTNLNILEFSQQWECDS